VDFKVIAWADWIKLTHVSVQSHVSVQTVLQFNDVIYLEKLGTGTENVSKYRWCQSVFERSTLQIQAQGVTTTFV
jgi:hypothetical protein